MDPLDRLHPDFRRIADACRAKGIHPAEIQEDLLKLMEFTQRVLLSDTPRETADALIKQFQYVCLACRADVHDVCMNDRPPGFPLPFCVCTHLMFSAEEKES